MTPNPGVDAAAVVAAAIEHVRARAVPPALFDRYLPDGVLFDYGWAMWGPLRDPRQAFQGTGYTNDLRIDDEAAYAATLDPRAATDPGVLTPDDVRAVRLEQNENEALDVLADFPALYGGGVDGPATSAVLQAAVFSPEPEGSDPHGQAGGIGIHDFAAIDDLSEVAGAAGMSLYHNIGVANVAWARTGYLDFNRRYSLEVRTSKPPDGGNLLLRGQWVIAPRRVRFIAIDQHVVASPFQITRIWPHFVFDPTHPEVVALCMRHVRAFVQRFTTAKGFFLVGENLYTHAAEPSSERITHENFDRRAPRTNFAPYLVAGFAEYMRSVVGGDELALAARWAIAGITFASIDVRQAHWTPSKPVVAQDYTDYLEFVVHELSVLHYIEAKRARVAGWYSILGFGAGGVERSALYSDFPSSGNFYGDEASYFRSVQNSLALMADAVRLSGKPVAFAISGVPYRPRKPTPRFDSPWYRRCFKEIDRDHVRLFFRETLTAGIAHIGYIKSLAHGLLDFPPSIEAVNDGLREIRDLRRRALAFMGPTQRVAIQVDNLQRIGFEGIADEEPSTYLGALLSRHLRLAQVPCAVFSDDRVLQRTFSRWQLRRTLTLVALPARPEPHVFAYGELLAGNGTGGAVFVLANAVATQMVASLQAAGGAATLVTTFQSRTHPGDSASLISLTLPGIGLARVFVFAFRDPTGGEGLRQYGARCAELLGQAFDALAAVANVVLRPARAATVPDAPLVGNSVTDGLNALLAVSWPQAEPSPSQPIVVTVDGRWQARFDAAVVVGFDTEFVGAGNQIAPPQTRFVHVEARLSAAVTNAIAAGGMDLVIADLRGALGQLAGDHFDVAHGVALVASAEASLRRVQPARALAGLAALARMVFVRASRTDGSRITVHARRVWQGGGVGVGPVANAQAQVILPLNGHEVQPAVAMTGGIALLTITPPVLQRWDFAHGSRFKLPAQSDVEQFVEVHVTDQETGGHGFVTVGPVPVA